MRTAVSILMMLHGVAHVPGVIVSWRLSELKDLPYKTTLFNGRVDVGDAGMSIAGAFWLVCMLAFVAAGVMGLTKKEPWIVISVAVATQSLVLSAATMPQARIGMVLNIILLLVLVLEKCPRVILTWLTYERSR